MNFACMDSLLLRKPYLELVTNDLYSIAKRIKSIEPGYFIVFNRNSHKYEVHSTMNKGWNTFCFTVPYSRLDYRTLELCEETNIAMRGDTIIKEMDQNNARIEDTQKKDFKRNMEDASLETADMVSLAAEQDELHGGYKRSHHIGGTIHEGG